MKLGCSLILVLIVLILELSTISAWLENVQGHQAYPIRPGMVFPKTLALSAVTQKAQTAPPKTLDTSKQPISAELEGDPTTSSGSSTTQLPVKSTYLPVIGENETVSHNRM
jgi:hypothetical protein